MVDSLLDVINTGIVIWQTLYSWLDGSFFPQFILFIYMYKRKLAHHTKPATLHGLYYICTAFVKNYLFARQIRTKSPVNEYIYATILGLTLASKLRAILENGICNQSLLYLV